MALGAIQFQPGDDQAFWVWAQAHAAHHFNCVQAASKKYSRQFDNYILDPLDIRQQDGVEDWLNDHAQMHQEMDLVLKTPTKYDLTSFDWEDPVASQLWFAFNFANHVAWAASLGVT